MIGPSRTCSRGSQWTTAAGTALTIRGLFLALLGFVFLPAPVSAQTEAVEYYALDAIGSVRVVFDANGAIMGRLDFGPFGGQLVPAASAPKSKFAGLFRDDESGLDYAQARMYESRTGRFTRPDPIYAGLFEPQRLNRYAYAMNNPLRFIDPDGLVAKDPSLCTADIKKLNPDDWHCTPGFWTGGGPDPSAGDAPVGGHGGGRFGGGGRLAAGPFTLTGKVTDPVLETADPETPQSSPQDCPAVPAAPPNTSLNKNVLEATIARTALKGAAGPWFSDKVRNAGGRAEDVRSGKSWDYKQVGYETFGNFNYGATGAAAGLSRLQIAVGSLYAHVSSQGSSAFSLSNIVNEVKDQVTISKGFSYAAKGCS